ncbi:hypothetical protein [Pseudoxanthomonas indica]|uniref:hypothetical protein n=1 Tax=Pseudoxanthomonas indica TaxID=428993 RepID=UPI0009A712A0|nr:hypothetical protein [Pseudoxanthomonas indica]
MALPDEAASRWLAIAITAAILVLVTQLLLRGPLLPERVAGVLMRVSFIPRPRSVAAPAPLPATTTMTSEQARAILQAHAGDASADLAPPAVRPAPTTPAQTMTERVYTSIGTVRVPPGSRIDPMKAAEIPATAPGLPNERQLAEARKVLERPNPIQYDETRFAKDWVSDGTLGDVAAQKLNSAAATIAKKIFGEDIQSPVARPPPDVRYNPALYEQSADLGRAATGDAYKAAPIAYEKVPDLKGEGSRRIRVAMEALQKRISACDAAKVKPLMATVRSHLTELERVEYALAHGADPIQAQQMLPRRGDSNYDLARRALWYADHELASCKR